LGSANFMVNVWRWLHWQMGIALAATGGVLFPWNIILAQIIPDSTLGAERSVVAPNVDIKGLPSELINGGATRGTNLFHSFQKFNVREGRGAYFNNPTGIENIFSRVTGKSSSNIFGTLGVLGNANLFLLNPNGIIFGPNAKLDVGGSFFGSTANSLNFGEGKEFSATNPNVPPLLTMKVPLGVQFGKQPSAIVNSGNLSVGNGQNLTLTGGTVASTGQLSAPQGQVAVAAVPSESVVNISPSAQLVNIQTPSVVVDEGLPSVSLAELLANVDESARPGLTVNSNGQVELAGSGIPVKDGDVVAKNVTAQTATLIAKNNLTLVESLLSTNGDLNLLAGDTVRVRDSVNNPFVAQAGDNLTIQGNQGIDILALNHPQTPFVSGGNLSLISNGIISGDAHFASGGNFSILNISGSGGNFVSLYDPIIRSNQDVEIGNYRGASLKIEAGGNITTGEITINSPDITAVGDPDSAILTGGRALILRAGTPLFFPSDLLQPNSVDGSTVTYSPLSSEGSLTINGNITSDFGGPLTVILEANGGIGSISTRDINSTVFSGDGGNISITANGDITTGSLTSFIDRNGQGDAGNIQITSNTGNITIGGFINSESSNGVAGNVTLQAHDDIRTGNITASSNSDENFSTIKLESSQGSVILNGVTLSTTNTGSDFAGNINIIATNVKVDMADNNNITSKIISNGFFGIIDINAGEVSIKNSELTAITPKTDLAEGVTPPAQRAGSISITSTSPQKNIEISNSSLTTSTESEFADSGSISLTSEQGKVLIQGNSKVSSRVENDSGRADSSNSASINIEGNSVEIINSFLDAATLSFANGGNISLNARNRGSITLKNSTIFTDTFATGKGGDINITTENGSVSLDSFKQLSNDESKATLVATVNKDASGQGGNINIQARNIDLINEAKIQTQTAGTLNPNDPNKNAQAGNITVKVQDFVTMLGQSELNAKTTGSANAGSMEIAANKLTIEGGSKATTTSEGSGKAGNIIVAADSVVLSGSGFTDFREANTPGIGLLAEATKEGGTAGSIFIGTNELRIENGATVTVSSPNGQAGNLVIVAKKILLNNGALRATTGQANDNLGEGANILLFGLGNETTPEALSNLQNNLISVISLITDDELRRQGKKSLPGSPLDFLILGNESLIETNAKNSVDGGNIAIRTRLLLALPPTGKNGNDISANAAKTGRGGVVAIDPRPLGIYGTEFRSETQNTPFNDITASSEQGLEGTVAIVPIDADPKRGILQLPEDLGDSSRLITQSCPVGRTQSASSFIVTGRGGLAPSPSSALSSDVLMGTTTNVSPRETPSLQSSSPRSTLIEAKGVSIGPKGEIIFTANPSKPTSDNSRQRNTGCNEQ
jgi:filamentous hemagglutinin family protein